MQRHELLYLCSSCAGPVPPELWLSQTSSASLSSTSSLTTKITLSRYHNKALSHQDTSHQTNKCTPRAALSSTDRCVPQPLRRSPARLDYFLASHCKKTTPSDGKKKSPPPLNFTHYRYKFAKVKVGPRLSTV